MNQGWSLLHTLRIEGTKGRFARKCKGHDISRISEPRRNGNDGNPDGQAPVVYEPDLNDR